MTSALVVETSVTVTDNSPSQDYPHPDDHTTRSTVTPGFKPFLYLVVCLFFCSPTRKNSQASIGASPCASLPTQASSSSSSEVAMETNVKCRVCDLPANAIFSPCGHVVACMDCATMLKKCFRCKVKFLRQQLFFVGCNKNTIVAILSFIFFGESRRLRYSFPFTRL